MNPVTAMLLAQVDSPELEAWVRTWDQIEALLIEAYRNGSVSRSQQREYRSLREMLRRGYKARQRELEGYWKRMHVEGKLLERDPYLELTERKTLDARDVDWGVMQKLPAAREALNALLLDLSRLERGALRDNR